ncbi:VanZ family protein [Acidipropionibacterium jensenii]|uniref:VanZ family protein n=1 Tax=Acidipropionibacterium jensenii TaxID=1749 RepID=A0A3T0S1X3_9ACTN|nr:VanZ family protein [Acidipropionibacterium jensenii]AZZ40228.1 VanZ family protein [Acidipropionibacterium jensenii]
MSTADRAPSRVRLCRGITAGYLVLVGLAVLTPIRQEAIAVKRMAGVRLQGGTSHPAIDPVVLGDVVLNIVGFIPLTLLLSLGWPKVRPYVWAGFCLLMSVACETLQLIPALNRRADLLNIVENGSGALIGAWVAVQIRRLSARTVVDAIPVAQPEVVPAHQ